MEHVIEHAKNGGYLMGICNGFQVLVEAHLLPGVLLRNNSQKFISKNIYLKAATNNSLLTQELDTNKELDTNVIKNWNDKITDAIEAVKTMTFGKNLDAEGNRIIYSHPNVLLQKWNHIVLNYNGGTLDVFYNGKLVKSAIEVAPYIKYDFLTVGTENGVKGNIANLTYFKQPLDILTIHTLYTSLKDKNPPSIPENPQKLIPLPNV
jgi:hypothetical protein